MPAGTRSTSASASGDDDSTVEKVVSKMITSQTFVELASQIRACIASEFQVQLKVFSEKVVQLENELSDTKSDLSKISTELDVVKSELLAVKTELKTSKDETEQYSRRNSLRIFGVPETANEDVTSIVAALCKDHLELPITTDMIDCAHRLPAKEGETRPIIVKFIARNVKNLIFKSKKRLKGSKIVICEDLTKYRQQLLKECIKMYGSKQVWTSECNIFVKRGPKDIKRIKSPSDLNN
ncbi:hypothetical protein PPYR_03918 [Photinus pyralis]|uniref:Uncharacterized protein n=1 Tax=Photinus pyralis TaxID=7054 RepID=A0A5N4AWJ0_PHOPY|nr:hypothetical protein PPYR_03918 [Photinus pyralis]